MLKLNNKSILAICTLVAVLFNCTGSKTDARAEQKTADSPSIKTDHPDAGEAAIGDSLSHFTISLEGYMASPLGQAVYDGNIARIQKLIEQGASAEKCLTDETYVYDILYAALTFNRIDVARFVLKEKLYSSANTTYTEESECPLTLACALPDTAEALEMAKILLANGADANGTGESGGDITRYPLLIAVKQNNYGLAKLLVDHGAKKEVVNESGETPLSLAVKLGFDDLVHLLGQ